MKTILKLRVVFPPSFSFGITVSLFFNGNKFVSYSQYDDGSAKQTSWDFYFGHTFFRANKHPDTDTAIPSISIFDSAQGLLLSCECTSPNSEESAYEISSDLFILPAFVTPHHLSIVFLLYDHSFFLLSKINK